jgi:hypothetical protein
MARSKGKDFENCLMFAAISKYKSPTDSDYKAYQTLWNQSAKEVKDFIPGCMESIFNQVGATTTKAKIDLCKTFEQLGGTNPEPKTDILFQKGGTKYKCSMKWGDSFQASSAGVEGTRNFLMKVIKEVVNNQNLGNITAEALGETIAVLEGLDGVLGTERIDTEQAIQSKLARIRVEDGLQMRLQTIFGSGKNPNVGEAYYDFKRSVIYESLTGALTFGVNSDKTANYVLTGPKFALKKIDDSYINHVMGKSSVRISAKGRGTKGTGGEEIRYQEATIRFDLKD